MKDWIIFGIVIVLIGIEELRRLREEKRMNDYFNTQHRT
jgi:hypothetical protein